MVSEDYQNYLTNLMAALDALISKLEKIFPGISPLEYNVPNIDRSTEQLKERMAFGLYIEFIRMGINPCLKQYPITPDR